MDTTVKIAVMDAIAKQKQIEAGSITPESTLDALGVTSLDAITIVYEIEDIFDIEVPNEELDSLQTVSDIIQGVEKLIQA
ncbi:MAG: phosphopantetheine-binding protein [Chromatiales bacterium]|nr:phosphopantetheine-binding protein [Chromatiales bacterium]